MKLILVAKVAPKEVDAKALKALKKLLKLDGYSQAEAGKLLGVTQKQISRYLAEEATITPSAYNKILKALGADKD